MFPSPTLMHSKFIDLWVRSAARRGNIYGCCTFSRCFYIKIIFSVRQIDLTQLPHHFLSTVAWFSQPILIINNSIELHDCTSLEGYLVTCSILISDFYPLFRLHWYLLLPPLVCDPRFPRNFQMRIVSYESVSITSLRKAQPRSSPIFVPPSATNNSGASPHPPENQFSHLNRNLTQKCSLLIPTGEPNSKWSARL